MGSVLKDEVVKGECAKDETIQWQKRVRTTTRACSEGEDHDSDSVY